MNVYQPHHAHLAPGSLGDSILKIPEYVKKAKQYGLTPLTMTDHGSLSAMYVLQKVPGERYCSHYRPWLLWKRQTALKNQ